MIINVPAVNVPTTSPLLAGLQQGQNIVGTSLANQASQIHNQFLAPLLQHQVAQMGAQTAGVQEKTQLLPQMLQAQMMTAQAKATMAGLSGGRLQNSTMYAISRYLNTPQMLALQQNNPKAAASITNYLYRLIPSLPPGVTMPAGAPVPADGGVTNIPTTTVGYGSSTQVPTGTTQGAVDPSVDTQTADQQTPAPQFNIPPVTGSPYDITPFAGSSVPGMSLTSAVAASPDAIAPAVSAPTAGVTQSSPVSQSDIDAVRSAAGSALQKKVTPTAVLNQRYYALSAENMLNQMAPTLPNVASYAGSMGKLDILGDHMLAAAGLPTSQAYKDYNNFFNVSVPLLSNEIRRAFAGQATDTETRIMKQLADPVFVTNNPQLAISNFNTLKTSLQQQEKALIENPQQVKDALTTAAASTAPLIPDVSSPLPTFKNPQEFQSYYLSQSPARQSWIRANIPARRGGV